MKMAAEHKILAAIDLGTTYSGYAYAFKNAPETVKTSHFRDSTPSVWRTQTSVLVNKDKKFITFGQDADRKYTELWDSGDRSHFLFKWFKQSVNNNSTLSTSTQLPDISGRFQMAALDLFVMCVNYLKNHLMRALNTSKATYSEDEVSFVLIVPALWNERAKSLMRAAAMKAGIKSDQFTLALESEAASIWCQTLSPYREIGLRDAGARFVLVDLGGGVADIIAHKSGGDGTLQSIQYPGGGEWGGTSVDQCFRSYLALLFGSDVLSRFIADDTRDFVQLMETFERAKRELRTNNSVYHSVVIPQSLLHAAMAKRGLKDISALNKAVASTNFGDRFQLKDQTLMIHQQMWKAMFDFVVKSISEELSVILEKPEMDKNTMDTIDCVVFTGALSDNEIVQDMLNEAMEGRVLFFPPQRIDGSLLVAKGAVLYGNNPKLIKNRSSKLTYGIRTVVPYNDKKHKGGQTTHANGNKVCTNVFNVLLKRDKNVNAGHEVKTTEKPLTADDKIQKFEIFSSGTTDSVPTFTSDGTVQFEGGFSIPLPFGCLVDDKIFERTAVFGDTEIYFIIKFKKGKQGPTTHYLNLK